MELMPRISRAQSMDILSSQSNLAGYKAVLEAASEFGRAFPLMMTAAGTVPPARVLVMGAGVAGLQAIATARRLGAVVSATDTRSETKEQVESLGATFIGIEDGEFKGSNSADGYAVEMSASYKLKQLSLIKQAIVKQDIVICTALIPGRSAPELITTEMIKSMKLGSVIVDLAVESGGNCVFSESNKIVEKCGIKIIGYANMPSRMAADASRLFGQNLFNFLMPLIDKSNGNFNIDMKDETVSGTLITRSGAIVHPLLVDNSPIRLTKVAENAVRNEISEEVEVSSE